MKSTKYDWVVFDYGGTLTTQLDNASGDRDDLQTMYGRIMAEWFELGGYRVPHGHDELQEMTVAAHAMTPGRAGQGSLLENIEYYTRWMACIYQLAGIEVHVLLSELESARLYMIKRFTEITGGPPDKTMISVLDALTEGGILMGVISNNAGYVEDMVFQNGILDYFEFVIDSARVGICKPDRGIFDLAVSNHGMQGQKLLYVGDSYEADVVGAENAGWDVAWITSDDTTPLEGEGKYRIRSLSELPAICLLAASPSTDGLLGNARVIPC